MNLAKAMNTIKPNAKWMSIDDTYEKMIMLDNSEKPTLEELESAVPQYERIEAEGHLKKIVQNHLDATSKSWGYDSIYTAIGYIGDPNDIFNKEGLMFRNWRSAVWTYVNEELAKLKQGLRTIPTEEEAIAELPLLDTYRIQQGL